MLDQVLRFFRIRSHFDLDLMRPGQSPTEVAAVILARLEPIVAAEEPDWVLVQGDTTTTVAGALAGFYGRVRVAHVEAGLRTGDMQEPFPEEGNRRITSSIAHIHFAPTIRARRNLLAEGVPCERILVTGNTVIDALRVVAEAAQEAGVSGLAFPPHKRLILVTVHRRENLGERLTNICAALGELSERYRESVHMVFPVHPNPKVRDVIYERLAGVPGIDLVPPLDYMSFIGLLQRSHLVMTDSGGVQEEAASLGKPMVVLREKTERPEVIEAERGILVGTCSGDIVSATADLLENDELYQHAAKPIGVFGDGTAAKKIVEALIKLGGNCRAGHSGVVVPRHGASLPVVPT
jgi:UDP-N-acetylglucosamine 2-epimerase (non-hydrolysing)